MPHGVLHTAMVVAQTDGVARSALLAVEEVLATTNSANSTVITMELSFVCIVIIEFADFAEIFPHVDTAIRANLGDRLLRITNRTDNLFNVLTNNLVAVVNIGQCARGLVVTMATRVDFVATWGSDFASPPVVLTPETHLAEMKALIGCNFHESRRRKIGRERDR